MGVELSRPSWGGRLDSPSLAAAPRSGPGLRGVREPPLRLEEASGSLWPGLSQPPRHLLPGFLSSDSLPSRPDAWILPVALGQPVPSTAALPFSQRP